MKKITTIAALVLSVIASGQTLAATSATLTLEAKVPPGTCSATFTNGELEWKDIDSSKIDWNKELVLDSKKTTLNVTCTSARMFLVSAMDNVSITDKSNSTLPQENVFGLVNAGKTDLLLGVYTIKALVADSRLDGDSKLSFGNIGAKEFTPVAGDINFTRDGVGSSYLDMVSTSGSGKGTRAPATSKSFALEVTPHILISDGYGPTSGDLVQIQGSATFEIVYI